MLPETIKERFNDIKQRANPILRSIFILSFLGFIVLGSFIWYTNNIKYERLSSKEQEAEKLITESLKTSQAKRQIYSQKLEIGLTG